MNQTLAASIAIATLTTAASAGIAPAVLDVFLSAEDGRVLTSGFSDETKSVVAPGQRVFAAVLGEDPEFPFSGDEPGIRGDLLLLFLRHRRCDRREVTSVFVGRAHREQSIANLRRQGRVRETRAH